MNKSYKFRCLYWIHNLCLQSTYLQHVIDVDCVNSVECGAESAYPLPLYGSVQKESENKHGGWWHTSGDLTSSTSCWGVCYSGFHGLKQTQGWWRLKQSHIHDESTVWRGRRPVASDSVRSFWLFRFKAKVLHKTWGDRHETLTPA